MQKLFQSSPFLCELLFVFPYLFLQPISASSHLLVRTVFACLSVHLSHIISVSLSIGRKLTHDTSSSLVLFLIAEFFSLPFKPSLPLYLSLWSNNVYAHFTHAAYAYSLSLSLSLSLCARVTFGMACMHGHGCVCARWMVWSARNRWKCFACYPREPADRWNKTFTVIYQPANVSIIVIISLLLHKV